MPISEVASLVGGAALGAPFSEILKLVTIEAKKVKDFKPLSEDLASTMERLIPVMKEIDSMQQGLDPCQSELKVLVDTIERAKEIVRKCSRVQWYSIAKKASYTRLIKGINQDFLRFCQIELQVIQYKNQLKYMRPTATALVTDTQDAEHLASARKPVDVLGVPWHPECHSCDGCHKSIAIHEAATIVSNSRGNFHKSCYGRCCYVCKEKITSFNQHPFWRENYCPAHESDNTPKCCSCERLEPRGTKFVRLKDGRQLCLECMESAVMNTDEVQPLHFEIREFFEGLYMKIEKQFPILLVEKQALNQAEKEEKIDSQYETVTRGICLSDAQTVTSVSKSPRMGPNNELIGMATESQRVDRGCEVTVILILYGFPRVLTGYILAHEMMHAYLRLNGHRVLNNVLEEGICQVIGHMWLDSQRYVSIEAEASSSVFVSHAPAAAYASKKGKCFDFEKTLEEFFKDQIETDDSPVHGVGFQKVHKMVTETGLQETLKAINHRS